MKKATWTMNCGYCLQYQIRYWFLSVFNRSRDLLLFQICRNIVLHRAEMKKEVFGWLVLKLILKESTIRGRLCQWNKHRTASLGLAGNIKPVNSLNLFLPVLRWHSNAYLHHGGWSESQSPTKGERWGGGGIN